MSHNGVFWDAILIQNFDILKLGLHLTVFTVIDYKLKVGMKLWELYSSCRSPRHLDRLV